MAQTKIDWIFALPSYELKRSIRVEIYSPEDNDGIYRASVSNSLGIEFQAEGHNSEEARKEMERIIEEEYRFFSKLGVKSKQLCKYARSFLSNIESYIGQK